MKKLNFEKFELKTIVYSNRLMGGKGSDCAVPNGGCSCDTGGGTYYNADGSKSFSYSSDNNIYNSDGSMGTTDFDGVTR